MNRVARLRGGVPAPFKFEAPSSWISRLALAQGCSLLEIRQFLGLQQGVVADLDLAMHGAALDDLRRRCGLSPEAFAATGAIMGALSRVDRSDCLVIGSSRGKGRFQYCPGCLGQGFPAHLDIRWRFFDWWCCPVHHCRMEWRCWRCQGLLAYPADMSASFAGMRGNASQRQCLGCAADLAAAAPQAVNPASLGRAPHSKVDDLSMLESFFDTCMQIHRVVEIEGLSEHYASGQIGSQVVGHSFSIVWSAEHRCYACVCRELPSFSCFADSDTAALAGMVRLIANFPPEALLERTFSLGATPAKMDMLPYLAP